MELVHAIFLAPRNLRWLVDFWKICAPLPCGTIYPVLFLLHLLHRHSVRYSPALEHRPAYSVLKYESRLPSNSTENIARLPDVNFVSFVLKCLQINTN